MEINVLLEEAIRDRFSWDVTFHKVNEKQIYVEETNWNFYLNEDETEHFQQVTTFPSLVYDWDEGREERVYHLKLKTQSLTIGKYQLGNSTTVLDSRFHKEKQFSNVGPMEDLDEIEVEAIQVFYRAIEDGIKKTEKDRIRFILGMLEIENWGALDEMSKFKKYDHLKF